MSRSIWTSRIEDITFDDVVTFCGQQHQEGERLDYKEELSSKDSSRQIAKLACAFANKTGGIAIIGVAEYPPKSRMPEKIPTGRVIDPKARLAIIQACQCISPPVTIEVTDLLRNPEDDLRGFLIVRVPQGSDIPYSFDGHWYVRDHDVSDPRDADRIELQAMFDNRAHRASHQEHRVGQGIVRLRRALAIQPVIKDQFAERVGDVVFTIGPAMMDAPTSSNDVGEYAAPPDWREDIEAVTDGIYSVDYEGGLGWLVDRFGNHVFVVRPIVFLVTGSLNSSYLPPWLEKQIEPAEQRELTVLAYASRVLKPLVLATNAAHLWCQRHEFSGLLTIKCEVTGVTSTPLVIERNRRTHVLAANRTDETLSFSFDISASAMGQEGWDLAMQATDRLFWAWGRRRQLKIETESILEEAEKTVFSSEPCLNAAAGREGHHRPLNHELCYRCRIDKAGDVSHEAS